MGYGQITKSGPLVAGVRVFVSPLALPAELALFSATAVSLPVDRQCAPCAAAEHCVQSVHGGVSLTVG